ncbi:hypothetical protein [Paraburkholderia humisilvae]|uniref:hypothetical protein n=1 Tax=Paraburkholderia humisilvae TaxID=627669 RepID=UPI001583D0E0|nr:hypothetical protein [Paraburkholderia humisilvae]
MDFARDHHGSTLPGFVGNDAISAARIGESRRGTLPGVASIPLTRSSRPSRRALRSVVG